MRKSITYIAIFVLFVISLNFINKNRFVVEKERVDTIVLCRIDTLFRDRPVFKKEVVVDTIFIEKVPQNGLKLPITQRYYSDDSYKIWVSGYKPSLDSVEVYSKTLTNTIIKERTRLIYTKKTDWYLDMGASIVDNKIAPTIGTSVKFKNDFVVGANVGYFDKSVFYGIKLGIKLNR